MCYFENEAYTPQKAQSLYEHWYFPNLFNDFILGYG